MIYQLIYLAFCLILAFINYRVIKANKRVYHGINGVLHLACWITVFLITKNILITATLPFIGRLFFDTALNKMRGLPLNYVSDWVKTNNPRASKTDRLEWQIFKSGLLPKVIYLIVIIVLNVIYILSK